MRSTLFEFNIVFLVFLCGTEYGNSETERQIFSSSYRDHDYSYVLDSEPAEEDEWECGFPWSKKNENGSCECGDSLHESVYCNLNRANLSWTKVGILSCSCMTHDNEKNETLVGHCSVNCENGSTKDSIRINRVYHAVNMRNLNVSPNNFTDRVCGYLNRTGRLCGKCRYGHYLPAYSYDLHCIPCNHKWYNWLIFVAEAFLLLTVFLLVVLVFRISATSAQLSAFVLFSQNYSIPSNVQMMVAATSGSRMHMGFAKTFISIYSIWNLDFFRSLYPPLCLPLSTMEIMLLEYCIAFYPLLLLILVYLAVKSRLTRMKAVRCLWAPLHSVLNALHQTWNFKRSIIDSFSTFFILSYNKLLSISFHILMYTNMHNVRGEPRGHYVYNDASLKYFGPEHRFYGILSLVILTMFVVFPLVFMFLYPMKWFQRQLSRLRLNRSLLRVFMDSFQGCYKDGTNGTRDCRFFSGVYLLLRILLFIAYCLTLTSLFYSFATILFIAMGMIVIIVKPYKERYAIYNKVDAIMILIQALTTASILCLIFAQIKGERFITFSVFLVAVFSTIPLLYVSATVSLWLYKQFNIREHSALVTKMKRIFFVRNHGETEALLDDSHTSYSSTSVN